MVDTVERMNGDIVELVKVRALSDVPALRLQADDEGVFPVKSVTRWVDRGLVVVVDEPGRLFGRVVGSTIEPTDD